MTSTIKNPVFQDEDKARTYLEAQRWPHGVVCPFCGQIGSAKALPAQGALGAGWWHCGDCRKKFTVRVGTLYERSHVPIHKWLYATYLLCASKKGISSHQLSRMLGVTYKTAWFMSHRIREGMKPTGTDAGPLGGEGKVVEADETYFGIAAGKKRKKWAGTGNKMKVLSLVERGGDIRSMRIKDGTKIEIVDLIRANVSPESTLHTDGAGVYKKTGAVARHESVDHDKQYVRKSRHGKVHTNTLEGFFSVFKRGMVGTYQHCGEQHLNRYLAEFDFRQNTRSKLGIDDAMRAEKALAGITGKRLTYRRIGQA
jgi:transposase-like protein